MTRYSREKTFSNEENVFEISVMLKAIQCSLAAATGEAAAEKWRRQTQTRRNGIGDAGMWRRWRPGGALA